MRQAGEGYLVVRHRTWISLMTWLLLALAAMLLPAPRQWGALGVWVSPHYQGVKSVLNPTVHAVLMAMLAVLSMQILWSRKRRFAVASSFGIVILLAVLFEILQGLLPREFGRSCDIADLVPGAFGGALGCLLGLIIRVNKKNK